MHETELKFFLDRDAARKVIARLKALYPGDDRGRWQTLRASYFDTPDHALRKGSATLRVRREGETWCQTLKLGGGPRSGFSHVVELEVLRPDGTLDLTAFPADDAVERLTTLTGDAPLLPVCETIIRRRSAELISSDGARVEIAVDIGTIVAGSRAERIHEVEFELAAGDPRTLFDLARALVPEPAVHLSRYSKGARGYMLAAEGCIEPPPAPRNALTVPLLETLTSEQAAHEILCECLDQLTLNTIAVRTGEDPEGPHQLRVALRRLRSAFALFAEPLGSPELDRLAVEARWLGHVVGHLRDLDVTLHDIVAPDARARPHDAGFTVLADALAAQAVSMRKSVRQTLAGERAQSFLFDLARFTHTRGWLSITDFGQTSRLAEPVRALAARRLDRQVRAIRKRGHKIEKLPVEARHELRKDLKKLRYLVDFLAPLYPAEDTAPFVKALKRLQNILGHLNDLAMAEEMLAAGDAPGATSLSAQRAVGWVLGTRTARMEMEWGEVEKVWRQFEKAKPFWH